MINTWPLLVKITTHVEVKVATQPQFSGLREKKLARGPVTNHLERTSLRSLVT